MRSLPVKDGAGSRADNWSWSGETLDGHRIRIHFFWGWNLQIELTTYQVSKGKVVPTPSWHNLVENDRRGSMYMFGLLTGCIYEGKWVRVEDLEEVEL